jgi:hypothetical protein
VEKTAPLGSDTAGLIKSERGVGVHAAQAVHQQMAHLAQNFGAS